jgi:hypothetical protein
MPAESIAARHAVNLADDATALREEITLPTHARATA